jgi:uroporphyrinogen-III synthase
VRLLVTRPEPECERTAALLRERGHDVMLLPLLRIEPLADTALGAGPWAAVLFTSVNAVRAVAAHRRFRDLASLPVYAVGRRTQAAAATAGFASVTSADGDVGALVRLISSKPSVADLPLLYCAGEERAGDLEGALQLRGLQVETALVYRSTMVTDLTPDVRAAFASGTIDAVLHYSARSAAAFVAAATTAGIRDLSIETRHLCLSAQVARPLAAAGAKFVEVASAPNEDALFALIDRA